MNLISDNADRLYEDVLYFIRTFGSKAYPRNMECTEITNAKITLTNPLNNIVNHPIRKVNRGFMAAELMWILEGREDVEFISQYNSRIAKYSDDGIKFFGAYGPKWVDQHGYILSILKKDPWTRQAVLNIWRESPPETRDVPCTIMMHFMRRPLDTLNMTVYMRSQDCWLGLPYDLHNFTCMQILIADKLGLKLGTFTLIQGSLHMYSTDYFNVDRLLDYTRNGLDLPEVEQTPVTAVEMFGQKLTWMREYLASKGK